jgi:hypothetical protein
MRWKTKLIICHQQRAFVTGVLIFVGNTKCCEFLLQARITLEQQNRPTSRYPQEGLDLASEENRFQILYGQEQIYRKTLARKCAVTET